jgi:hypothetical protein
MYRVKTLPLRTHEKAKEIKDYRIKKREVYKPGYATRARARMESVCLAVKLSFYPKKLIFLIYI